MERTYASFFQRNFIKKSGKYGKGDAVRASLFSYFELCPGKYMKNSRKITIKI